MGDVRIGSGGSSFPSFKSTSTVVPSPVQSTGAPIPPPTPPEKVGPLVNIIPGKTLEYELPHILHSGDEWNVNLVEGQATLASVLLRVKNVTDQGSELELSVTRTNGYDTPISCRQDAFDSMKAQDAGAGIDCPKPNVHPLREITSDPITFNMSRKWDIVIFEGSVPNFCFRGQNESQTVNSIPDDPNSKLVSKNVVSVSTRSFIGG
jgi:hypothetical protein